MKMMKITYFLLTLCLVISVVDHLAMLMTKTIFSHSVLFLSISHSVLIDVIWCRGRDRSSTELVLLPKILQVFGFKLAKQYYLYS